MASKRKKLKEPSITTKRDLVQIQVSVRYRKPKGNRQITRELLSEAVKQWVETGKGPAMMKIAVKRWRNPKRLRAEDRRWRTGSKEEARRTLLRVLKSGRLEIGALGAS